MSTLEDRLRDAFRADAETVRPETIPGLPERAMQRAAGRARSRRTRWLIPVAAAAAVALIATGVSVGAGLLEREHHASRQASGLALPPDVPQFYVSDEQPGLATVSATATGKIVGEFGPPRGTSLDMIAAPAGDRTFVVAATPNHGRCVSQLYSFRLNSRGQPGPLTPLHVTLRGTFSGEGSLAITPDGGTIAYATYICDQGRAELGVIDLATRKVKVWSNPSPATMDLSLSANGSLLAFETLTRPTSKGGPWTEATMILRTSAPAGPLLDHSRIVSRTAEWAALAGDGTSLYGCTVSPRHLILKRGTVTYYTYSIASGRQKIIASWRNLPDPTCWASLDPSGRYLLVQYPVKRPGFGDLAVPGVLDIRSGQITRVPAAAFPAPDEIAW